MQLTRSSQVKLWLLFLLLPPLVFSQPNPPTKPLGLILPMIVIVLAFVAMAVVVVQQCRSPAYVEPEEQFNVCLCQDRACKYQYKLIIHVGCPTAEFDMKHGFIDIEVLGPKDEIIGVQVRFDCSHLPDQVRGEMHTIIGRVTPIPPITAIRANHSCLLGSIFLYEYVLIDLSDQSVVDVRLFNLYLSRRPTIYRGIQCTDDNEPDSNNCPLLPATLWTKLELTFITVQLVLAIDCSIMLAEHYDLYPINQTQDGSLYRSLLSVLYTTPIGLFLLVMVTLPYKYYLQRKVLQSKCSLQPDNVKYWQRVCKIFLGFLWSVSLLLSVVLIYFGLHITFTKSLYWLCASLIVTVCVFGIWACVGECHCLERYFQQDAITQPSSFFQDGKATGKRIKERINPQMKTVLFETSKPSTSGKHNNQSTCPKITNPNKMNKNKQAKQKRAKSRGKRNETDKTKTKRQSSSKKSEQKKRHK